MERIFNELIRQGYRFDKALINHYDDIDDWQKWFDGYHQKFHNYQIKDVNNQIVTLKRYRLGMAKRVCQDWANLLLSNQTTITINDEASQKYLFDDKTGVLVSNSFWINGNKTIKNAFALGAGAFILNINRKDKNDPQHLEIQYINNAANIIPLSYEDGVINECAFVSLIKKANQEYLCLEKHLRAGSGYQICRECFLFNKGELEKLSEESWYSTTKLFFIIKPFNKNSNAKIMGESIFGKVIDQIRGCDVIFDTVYRGMLGKREGIDDDKVIYTHDNQSLNLNENMNIINFFLSSLGSKVGLGTNYYTFDNEITFNCDKDSQSVDKQRVQLYGVLTQMIRSILVVGHDYFNKNLNSNAQISIKFN